MTTDQLRASQVVDELEEIARERFIQDTDFSIMDYLTIEELEAYEAARRIVNGEVA